MVNPSYKCNGKDGNTLNGFGKNLECEYQFHYNSLIFESINEEVLMKKLTQKWLTKPLFFQCRTC